MIKFIKRLFCKHWWEYEKTPFGIYKTCLKCGKEKKVINILKIWR